MHPRHSDRIAIPLLPLVALFVISIALLPLHTAHAAPQRPLGSGCLNYSFYEYPYIPGVGNVFGDGQELFCDYTDQYMIDDTYFNLSIYSSAQWIVAQADTWLTQVPECCGHTRYAETGRSSLVAYPNNGMDYYIQGAVYNGWKAPMYGCNWVNFPDYRVSYDYICIDME